VKHYNVITGTNPAEPSIYRAVISHSDIHFFLCAEGASGAVIEVATCVRRCGLS